MLFHDKSHDKISNDKVLSVHQIAHPRPSRVDAQAKGRKRFDIFHHDAVHGTDPVQDKEDSDLCESKQVQGTVSVRKSEVVVLFRSSSRQSRAEWECCLAVVRKDFYQFRRIAKFKKKSPTSDTDPG